MKKLSYFLIFLFVINSCYLTKANNEYKSQDDFSSKRQRKEMLELLSQHTLNLDYEKNSAFLIFFYKIANFFYLKKDLTNFLRLNIIDFSFAPDLFLKEYDSWKEKQNFNNLDAQNTIVYFWDTHRKSYQIKETMSNKKEDTQKHIKMAAKLNQIVYLLKNQNSTKASLLEERFISLKNLILTDPKNAELFHRKIAQSFLEIGEYELAHDKFSEIYKECKNSQEETSANSGVSRNKLILKDYSEIINNINSLLEQKNNLERLSQPKVQEESMVLKAANTFPKIYDGAVIIFIDSLILELYDTLENNKNISYKNVKKEIDPIMTNFATQYKEASNGNIFPRYAQISKLFCYNGLASFILTLASFQLWRNRKILINGAAYTIASAFMSYIVYPDIPQINDGIYNNEIAYVLSSIKDNKAKIEEANNLIEQIDCINLSEIWVKQMILHKIVTGYINSLSPNDTLNKFKGMQAFLETKILQLYELTENFKAKINAAVKNFKVDNAKANGNDFEELRNLLINKFFN
jgi:hypothetical protein